MCVVRLWHHLLSAVNFTINPFGTKLGRAVTMLVLNILYDLCFIWGSNIAANANYAIWLKLKILNLHLCNHTWDGTNTAVGDPVIKRGGLRSSYQEGRVVIQLSRGDDWDPINWFNPATFLCLFQLRWDVIVSFVDIDDHRCLNFFS